jgi:hypothetical protein
MKLTKKSLSALIKEELNLFEANQGVDPKTGRSWSISPTTGQKHWGNVEDKPPGQDPITPDQRIKKMEDDETNDAGDAYWVMVDDLVTTVHGAVRVNGTEDEVFIKTGPGDEGITVKVVRRGQ